VGVTQRGVIGHPLSMGTLLYAADDARDEVFDWLRRDGDNAPLTVLCEEGASEWAHSLQVEFPQIESVQTASEGNPAFPRNSEIVVPLPPEDLHFRYVEGLSLPAVSERYGLFRKLRKLGIRAFRIVMGEESLDLRLDHLADDFAGKHKGQRAVVMGNGPSLNELDLARIKDEITFGSNRVYLGFEKWGFTTTYWGISDWLQIEEYGGEYASALANGPVAFYPFEYWPLSHFPGGSPLNLRGLTRPAFHPAADWMDYGHSVTYVLIQLAALMGCDPILLIGVVHRYEFSRAALWRMRKNEWRNRIVRPIRGTAFYRAVRSRRQARRLRSGGGTTAPPIWATGDTERPTHFDPPYTRGKRFAMPEPYEAERDYREAAKWAKREGVEILNATPNSNLDVFPRIEFEDLF
jgi:hypothetical protein